MGFCGCGGKSSKDSDDEINRNNKSSKKQPDKKQPNTKTPRTNAPAGRLKKEIAKDDQLSINTKSLNSKAGSSDSGKKVPMFTFGELAAATNNFRADRLLGEGGFGKVYKGYLEKISRVVAIKQLDPNGYQGINEFVVEVMTLSKAEHPNLVKLIGYCGEVQQMLLVYEFMPLGSLDIHLHDLGPHTRPLDWTTRMKIAAGAATGLHYLHEQLKPPIIYRDLKCANILLDEEYNAKLSDFGLAKFGPTGDKSHVSTRVMGTHGYCAPDYLMTGKLNFKSDIYSYGVVLLELITGRKAIEETPDRKNRNLVAWARPMFRDNNFDLMADPKLNGQYPKQDLHRALALAAMCVQESPKSRPDTVDIVSTMIVLTSPNNRRPKRPVPKSAWRRGAK